MILNVHLNGKAPLAPILLHLLFQLLADLQLCLGAVAFLQQLLVEAALQRAPLLEPSRPRLEVAGPLRLQGHGTTTEP